MLLRAACVTSISVEGFVRLALFERTDIEKGERKCSRLNIRAVKKRKRHETHSNANLVSRVSPFHVPGSVKRRDPGNEVAETLPMRAILMIL